MFEAKAKEKLESTDARIAQNKAILDECEAFNPFETMDINGLAVFKNPDFEPYAKVIASLRVTDENGQFLPRQTSCLQRDILPTAKRLVFLELLYRIEVPTQDQYIKLLEEKLLLLLVNLVLEEELPLNRALKRDESALALKTFKDMLDNI